MKYEYNTIPDEKVVKVLEISGFQGLFSLKNFYALFTKFLKNFVKHDGTNVLELCTHHARMTCDSGLELNFLQEFYLVALDVFKKSEYAKRRDPKDRLVGWLSFFCTEDADEAEELCKTYPWLSELYAEMAEFGRKPEELISMFSEILREMDRNTIRYMVDDMKEQIEKGKKELAEINKTLSEKNEALAEKEEALAEKEEALAEKDEILKAQAEEIAHLKALLATTKL